MTLNCSGVGCSVVKTVRLMPEYGKGVKSAYMSVQIQCRGQNGYDKSLAIYVDGYGSSMPNASSLGRLATSSNGFDMTHCEGRCASAGFVSVVKRFDLDVGPNTQSIVSVRITVLSDIQGSTYEKPSAPNACTQQETLIVKLRLLSVFWYEEKEDPTLYLSLALAWIPIALTSLFFYTRYHKRMLLKQACTDP